MTEFRFPPVLSIAAWEAEIDAPRGAPAGGPSGDLALAGPHLDFGRVEYVEFGVPARALPVLDAAVAAGVGATVTLPARELPAHGTQQAPQAPDRRPSPHGAGSDGTRPGDPDSWSRARRSRHRIGRRGQVRAFMRQAGFQEAPHWPVDAVRVRGAGSGGTGEDFDEPPSGDLAAGRGDPAVEPMGYRRRLLPLQRLQPLEGAGVREPARYVALEQGLGDLGLPASDARAIGETVPAELIGNAARGARNPRVLVGGQSLDHNGPPLPDHPTGLAAGGDGATRVLRLFADGSGWPDALFEATVPVGPQIEVSARCFGPDGVRVVVRDAGVPAGAARAGRDAVALSRALKPFGGWLSGRVPRAGGDWSFESAVAVRSWPGV